MLPQELQESLTRQHYKFGSHSGVKLCHWTKESLTTGRTCYKEKFYGIECHRCMQMTPALAWCQQKCVFCWRPHEFDVPAPKWDEPKDVITECEEGQRLLLTGYGGNDACDKNKLAEAQQPNQAAISLAGEPTLYPKISGLIEEFDKRNYTTFLVTNGLLPNRLAEMTLPTQLYMSLDAPNKEVYKTLNVPMTSNGWEKINESLELFPSLDTRKVLRVTLVKGWNDFAPEEYARLIAKSDVDFIEIKAYMFIGSSRQRLTIENMPRHHEVKEFSEKIGNKLGYELVDEQESSRVVLLSSGGKKGKI